MRSCRQHQQRLHLAQQLLALDATAGARFYLQREDIKAVFRGQALQVYQCQPVEVSMIHWDYKHQGQCYREVPVEAADGRLLFMRSGSEELVDYSRPEPCGTQYGVYMDEYWRTVHNRVVVMPTTSLVASPSPLLGPVKSLSGRKKASDLRLLEFAVARLTDYVVSKSPSPEFLKLVLNPGNLPNRTGSLAAQQTARCNGEP